MFCLDATVGQKEPRFEDCCTVLQTEAWMFRMRTHLEFWNRHILFSAPMTGFVLPPPSTVTNMAYACAGDFGIWVCRKTLEWPGVTLENLLQLNGAPPEGILRETVAKLQTKGILLSRFENRYFYCVGHSPFHQNGQPDRRPWIRLWK